MFLDILTQNTKLTVRNLSILKSVNEVLKKLRPISLVIGNYAFLKPSIDFTLLNPFEIQLCKKHTRKDSY